jgi:hypothetical protein
VLSGEIVESWDVEMESVGIPMHRDKSPKGTRKKVVKRMFEVPSSRGTRK